MIPSPSHQPLVFTWKKQTGKDMMALVKDCTLYVALSHRKWSFTIYRRGKEVAKSRETGYTRVHTAQYEAETAYKRLVDHG